MSRSKNVAVFENTQQMCFTDPTLIEAIKHSSEGQKVYLANKKVEAISPRYENPAKVIVSQKRSFEAATGYPEGQVCVLNFASGTTPGGGVAKGATAQEECLCRCSTLFRNLVEPKNWDMFYSAHRRSCDTLYSDTAIYTPDVVVFKTDTQEPELLPKDLWKKVNVISCAAPNLRQRRDGWPRANITPQELLSLHIRRASRILEIAAANGNEVVILGAYGCGAFQNSPMVVAEAMKQAIKTYRHHFKVIEFAVFCTPENDINFRVFQSTFGGH